MCFGGIFRACDRCTIRRPVVKGADDTSNFEEYDLGPMKHLFKLSEDEQAMFEGI